MRRRRLVFDDGSPTTPRFHRCTASQRPCLIAFIRQMAFLSACGSETPVAVPSGCVVVYGSEMRDFILQEIRRLAVANGGQPPGQKLFVKETGIAEHQWRGQFWARWGDALTEAGFRPNDWTGKLDSDDVLRGIARAVRQFGRLPTRAELLLRRQVDAAIPSDQAIRRHFGRRDDIVTALVKRAAEDPAYADIAALLPTIASTSLPPRLSAKPSEGFVYLIKSGDFYKVGRSDDVERRFKQITIALPDKAELFHTIRTDDPSGIEAYWHRRFADRRANGEWFKLTAQDVAAFKKRKFQ